MFQLFSASTADQTIQQSNNTLKQISGTLFPGNSLFILAVCLVVGIILSKIIATLLRRVSNGFSKQADAATDLNNVNRLRRLETWTILSIAVVRVLLIILAIYFWWVYSHPANKPSGLIGASALFIIVLGGVVGPLLRDLAFGAGMMAEHWFGVGDLVTIVNMDVQGVVERITLRSTRIRGLNGEVVWVTNQNISAVRIAQKGVWTMAIEIFASDPKKAEELIERTNTLLPTGPSLVASRLNVMSTTERSKDIWHITALGEIAPGREWLLERTAIELMMKLDEKSKNPILLTDPVARYADNDTERQFARAVKNARKTRRTPRRAKLSKPKRKS